MVLPVSGLAIRAENEARRLAWRVAIAFQKEPDRKFLDAAALELMPLCYAMAKVEEAVEDFEDQS